MQIIEAIDIVRLGPGAVLQLTGSQASRRIHNLRLRDDGYYETLKPVEFKRGEVFGLDGTLPKSVRQTANVDGEAPPVTVAPAPAPSNAGAGMPRTARSRSWRK